MFPGPDTAGQLNDRQGAAVAHHQRSASFSGQRAVRDIVVFVMATAAPLNIAAVARGWALS